MDYTINDFKKDIDTSVNRYALELSESVIKTHKPEEKGIISYRIDSKDESQQYTYRMDILLRSQCGNFTDATFSAYTSIENFRRGTSEPAPLKEAQFTLFSEIRSLLRMYKTYNGTADYLIGEENL